MPGALFGCRALVNVHPMRRVVGVVNASHGNISDVVGYSDNYPTLERSTFGV